MKSASISVYQRFQSGAGRVAGWLAALSICLGGAAMAGAEDLPAVTASIFDQAEGWTALFDGSSLNGWAGDTQGYAAVSNTLVCTQKGGNLRTAREYGDFAMDFEFKLAPGANNGLGIRSPPQGDAAYAGMELQILDNEAPQYAQLHPYQYHGSIYGVVPAPRGHLKPTGEWNREQVICIGDHVRVILNGVTLVDAYLAQVQPVDGKQHPGLARRSGHIVWCGHGAEVAFRNIRIRDFTAPAPLPGTAANAPPAGFRALFDGATLAGWKGLVASPPKRAAMAPVELTAEQEKADARMREHWSVRDGALYFDGKGDSLCTAQDFADFDLYVDWKITPKADSGIYLRGSPQIQIWDPANEGQWQHGSDKGSGALWNNQKAGNRPVAKADKPAGEWNTFLIRMVGERVTVWLNGQLVLPEVAMENYWERGKPIYRTGQIELQNHGSPLEFKNLYVRELPY
jgi:hypothetical protein